MPATSRPADDTAASTVSTLRRAQGELLFLKLSIYNSICVVKEDFTQFTCDGIGRAGPNSLTNGLRGNSTFHDDHTAPLLAIAVHVDSDVGRATGNGAR